MRGCINRKNNKTTSTDILQSLLVQGNLSHMVSRVALPNWSEKYPSCKHTSLHKKWSFPLRISFSKCDQIRSNLRIWSHLLKKSIMENFIFCAVRHKYLKVICEEFIFRKDVFYLWFNLSITCRSVRGSFEN